MSFPDHRASSLPSTIPPLLRHVGAPAIAPARDAGAERRGLYRVAVVRGPAVRIEVRRPDGTRLHGVVEDCSWSGAAARFSEAADPRIRVDQVGVVVVTSLRLPELKLRARVASADPLPGGGTRYGLQFIDQDELHAQVTPDWRRWFSRRRSQRFEPRGEFAATVTVTCRGKESRGRVVDASASGLGVELGVEAARAAVVARDVGVQLAFPGSGGTMRLRATVRGAKQGTPSVRIGLELVRDVMYETCRQRLEAWVERMRRDARARAAEQRAKPSF